MSRNSASVSDRRKRTDRRIGVRIAFGTDSGVYEHGRNGEEAELRQRLRVPARNTSQDLYLSDVLKTGRVMVKDEDLCLHCGLCAERCPTGAWDMQKFFLEPTYAGHACRSHHEKKKAA